MDEKLVEIKFLDQMTHPPEGDLALLLHAKETNRIIPIRIGLATAAEYSAWETDTTRHRPGVHEVFVDSLDMVGQSTLRGQIMDVHEGIFIASLVLEGDAEIDIRPSDLILIARGLEASLYTVRDVLDTTSVTARLAIANGGSLADGSETDPIEASVPESAESLDSINADYFAGSCGNVEDKRSDGEAGGGIDSASDGDR